MGWRRLTMACAFAVIGCATPVQTVPPGSASPTVVPTSASTPAPPETASAAPQESPSTAPSDGTPTATPDTRSEKERSDQYWAEASQFDRFAITFDSLRGITNDADVIVVGRIESQRLGEFETFTSGTMRPAMITTLTVEEVLKGDVVSRSPDTIEATDLGVFELADSELPRGRLILFLRSWAQWRLDEGVGPADDPNDPFYYVRVNGFQCVLREFDRRIDVIEGFRDWEETLYGGPFPSQLDGESFAAIVDRIRAIAAE